MNKAAPGHTKVSLFKPPALGRFVTIHVNGINQSSTLCEVAVYGEGQDCSGCRNRFTGVP